MSIKFDTAKSMNWYLKAKTCSHITRISSLKYAFIDIAAPNQMLKYLFLNYSGCFLSPKNKTLNLLKMFTINYMK